MSIASEIEALGHERYSRARERIGAHHPGHGYGQPRQPRRRRAALMLVDADR